MRTLHHFLMRKSYIYAKWHHMPYANFFHWFLLLGVMGLLFLALYRNVKQQTSYLNHDIFTTQEKSRNILGENIYVIFITPDGFEPSYAVINTKTTVLFENISSNFASVTFNARADTTSQTIEPGKAFQIKAPSVLGRHEYHNAHNPAQKGVLEVSEF